MRSVAGLWPRGREGVKVWGFGMSVGGELGGVSGFGGEGEGGREGRGEEKVGGGTLIGIGG